MMRFFALTTVVAVSMFAPYRLLAAPGITAPSVTVGRNLQMYATVTLPQAAPQEGGQLTLTSDDPSRLLLSTAPDKAGSATITLKVLPRFAFSPEFWLQGLADSGTVTYTVSAAGVGSAKGTVTLTPSAIAMLGPLKAPKFPTTPRGEPSKITLVSAALDSSFKILGEQQVAGGSEVEVRITSSNPSVGKLKDSKVKLSGGSSTAMTYFQPAAEGDTSLALVQPHGFNTPQEFATVAVGVAKPGLSIVGDVFLGKDLQIPAGLCLGEAAPPGGLKVILTSGDGSKLLLSSKEDQLGSASLTILVPAGQLTAQYYLQGLGDSGEVNYEAVAPGFRTRTAKVGLTPSGVIVAYSRYGPPDEASVLRKGGTNDDREFFVSLSDAKEHPVHVVAWTVHLDRESGRAADITVQALRPGVSAKVALRSANAAVGTVESPLTIESGTNHVASRFVPLAKGTTVISIDTPAGFSKSKNATSVPATVVD